MNGETVELTVVVLGEDRIQLRLPYATDAIDCDASELIHRITVALRKWQPAPLAA